MPSRRRFSLLAFTFIAVVAAATRPAGLQVNLETVGPQIGATVPAFAGVDQFGRTQTLQSVSGPEGTMLVFYRSADW